jgi:hypothetical protein
MPSVKSEVLWDESGNSGTMSRNSVLNRAGSSKDLPKLSFCSCTSIHRKSTGLKESYVVTGFEETNDIFTGYQVSPVLFLSPIFWLYPSK